ncbi:MAG: DUF2829 domain-containing protein [Paraburkholderia sp.]|uniref:DUF2829 domain-containing protein n=1 Tax=Paraburkholderia sp. TaxID=1926495 RepID=UPI0012120527|nr:DUF2829 domain-containing protein [Paraburkholderia sp.]TAM07238.1 MAG: DUF2829 domain-containing protein [Paraburkholderia sp.]TAM32623.1 MAG: DUF2829 domain-containing protein [Paraburkholderia sp.]
MQRFIGTKIIHAEPRAKNYGPSEQHGEPGYSVVYPDGYTSWSPKAAFEEAYRPADGMPFGLAIEALKKGLRVARAGWNGKGMWLAYSPGAKALPAGKFWAGPNRDYADTREDGCADVLPCITMKTAGGEILMGWLASQTDMLADDWMIVE